MRSSFQDRNDSVLCDLMIDSPDRRSNPLLSASFALLQILGLAGSNHLLVRVVRELPGFPASRIHGDLALFGESALMDLDEALLTLAIIPGVVEELLFRGLLFALLLRWRGGAWAVVGSALAFGAVHADPHLSLIAAILGLQLGLLRYVAGLPLAICAHVTNNALVLGAQYLAESPDPPLLLPDSPGMTLAIAAAFSIAACATLRQHLRELEAPPEP